MKIGAHKQFVEYVTGGGIGVGKRCDAAFDKWLTDHAGIVANYTEITIGLMRQAWRAAWEASRQRAKFERDLI